MKVTKFSQSCLLVEDSGSRVFFDPGFGFAAQNNLSDIGEVNAVFYTHEHPDHLDKTLYQEISAKRIPVYANSSTAKLAEGEAEVVNDGQEFMIGRIKIKALELAHSLLPDGSKGPQNTGYLINEKIFLPGDGKEIDGLNVDWLALPITGPDISMKSAFQFARQVNAKNALAIHYDMFGANAELYATFAERFNQPFKLTVLEPGESIEL